MENNISVNDVHDFIEWQHQQPKDYMGGEFLYNIKGYYKRIRLEDLFDYWMENIKNN